MKVASQEKAQGTIEENKGRIVCGTSLLRGMGCECPLLFQICVWAVTIILFGVGNKLIGVGKDVRSRAGSYVWNEGGG